MGVGTVCMISDLLGLVVVDVYAMMCCDEPSCTNIYDLL
jgi:hypothetical protein